MTVKKHPAEFQDKYGRPMEGYEMKDAEGRGSEYIPTFTLLTDLNDVRTRVGAARFNVSATYILHCEDAACGGHIFLMVPKEVQ